MCKWDTHRYLSQVRGRLLSAYLMTLVQPHDLCNVEFRGGFESWIGKDVEVDNVTYFNLLSPNLIRGTEKTTKELSAEIWNRGDKHWIEQVSIAVYCGLIFWRCLVQISIRLTCIHGFSKSVNTNAGIVLWNWPRPPHYISLSKYFT